MHNYTFNYDVININTNLHQIIIMTNKMAKFFQLSTRNFLNLWYNIIHVLIDCNSIPSTIPSHRSFVISLTAWVE